MSDYNLDMLRESMVKILGSDGQTVSGSGFIIRSDGYLVTCHHVIYQLGLLKVEYRGQVYEAEWCEEFSHPDVDIAILKIDVADAKAVAIINPQHLLTSVTVYGFPPKQKKFFPEGIDVFAKNIRPSAPVNTINTYLSREITANNAWNKLPQEKSTFKSHRINEKVEAGTSGGAVFAQELGGVVGVIQCSKSDESYVIRWDNITEILERLGLEPQKNAVANFLAEIEQQYKFIRLFHTAQEIVLQNQYIPIQVTLERKYRHDVESFWGYLESEAEAKRAYAFKGFDESRQVEVDWEKARKEHQKIMVLADPGMGKSTLLKMEALTTAKAEREKLFGNLGNIDEAIFPLVIRLSDLAETKAEIFDAIPRIIQRDYPKTAGLIDEILKEKLANGKCLLLLDALDEVPKAQRNRLAEKLNRFTRNYPCRIICTSRIVGYGGAFVEGAKEVEIVPFSQKQTEKYIQTWFNNAAGYINQDLCSGGQKPGFSVNENQLNSQVSQETGFFSAINNDAVSAEGLIGELGNKPQIQGLAQNPLLLSLLCSLYQEKELHLPARRSQVYQQAVDYMLKKWRGENKRQLCEDGWVIAKIGLLQDIAYHFSCDGKEIFSLQELSERIDIFLRESQKRDFRDVKTAELIKELAEEDGILQKLDRDGDKYLFLHRTFQEYFAASYLLGKRIDLAKAHFWEYDWHETLSLLAGLMKKPVPLVEAIMGEKDDIFGSLLLLAGKCIAECKDSEHPLFVEIIDRIYRFWECYPDADFIESAVLALGKANSVICRKLQEALNYNGNRDVRSKAAQALGQIDNPQAVAALISALHDENWGVRWKAAEALGNIGNPQAVAALIEALDDENMYVISNAAEALGKIGHPQAVAALIEAFRNEKKNAFVINFAATALGKIGHPQAVAALIQALYDEDSYVGHVATRVLGNIGYPQAVAALIEAFHDEDSYVGHIAARVLGNISYPQAVAALIEAFHDEDSFVRRYAARALGNIGNSQAVAALIEALHDEDNHVVSYAARALGNIGNSQAVAALIEAFHDEDSFVRRYAARALGNIGNSQAVAALIEALHDEDNHVVSYAAEALGNIGNPQAVAALIEALHDEDISVRGNAAEALGNIGNSQAVAALIEAFHDEDSYVRMYAAEALGKIGTSEILEKLIKFPHINIYRYDIFPIARKLAVRFSKERRDLIPVYPEKVRYSPIWVKVHRLFRIIAQRIRRIQRNISTRLTKRRPHPVR
ncbi:HEAT repeat domain-containing protein [Aerosakkonema funiforme]|uniref:HEAT repeat domain-containing protein n=1 Tax=Aerosakkonema funiforme FACHB-1375 TaxID=2949571 RepID=A0A926ZJX5_9CYAN|nr:HEAT repeat domain-containing protein [Aerosakkonema funiforme]MBD2183456.1 HEAT repeat domain-containing protein [Aerosakkonema funiforme FACHB-1375]